MIAINAGETFYPVHLLERAAWEAVTICWPDHPEQVVRWMSVDWARDLMETYVEPSQGGDRYANWTAEVWSLQTAKMLPWAVAFFYGGPLATYERKGGIGSPWIVRGCGYSC